MKYHVSCGCVVAHVVVHVAAAQENYPLSRQAVVDAVSATVVFPAVVVGVGVVKPFDHVEQDEEVLAVAAPCTASKLASCHSHKGQNLNDKLGHVLFVALVILLLIRLMF